MPEPAKKYSRILVLELSQRATDRIFGPTLRVTLFGIYKEAVKGSHQVRRKLFQREPADNLSSFGHKIVIGAFERFLQSGQCFFSRSEERRVGKECRSR